jgi:hypothetical protein
VRLEALIALTNGSQVGQGGNQLFFGWWIGQQFKQEARNGIVSRYQYPIPTPGGFHRYAWCSPEGI